MTREMLRSLGLTEEQIEKIMAAHGTEVQKANARAEQNKADAERIAGLEKSLAQHREAAGRAAALQKELDDEKKRAESDRAAREAEATGSAARISELEGQMAQLKAEIAREKTLKALAENGITGDDAASFFNEDGGVNFGTLAKVLSDREAAAAARKEKEIAGAATNPIGAGASASEPHQEETPYDVEAAKRLNFGGVAKDAMAARDYYK